MVEQSQKLPQKQSVFLLWLLSTITLGIYAAVWYVKRKPEFDNLNTQKKLSKGLTITFLVLTIIYTIQQIVTQFFLPSNLTSNITYLLVTFILIIPFIILYIV